MKTIRIIGLCLAAVFAFSAIAVASASATPEILFKTPTGGFPTKFTSKNLPSPHAIAKLVTAKHTVECAEQTDKGTLTDAHLGTVEVTFTKCKEGAIPCQNGATSGQIVAPLSFHLGLEHNSSSTEVPALLLLLPENKETKVFEFKFECFGVPVVVKGSVIGLLLTLAGGSVATGIKLTSFCLTLTQAGGVQNSKEFLLSLVGGGTGSLMTGINLTSSVAGGAAEEAGQESADAVEKFENSKKEAEEVEFVLA
jgi:hypothetical protein